MIKQIVFILLIFVTSLKLNSQTEFSFKDANKYKQQVSFKLINNLIIMPLEINGKKLSFILDTGVNKTILFNLSENDSIGLLNTKRVALQGLGTGEAVSAIVSKKNTFKLKNIISENETVYVILNDSFNLSSKMGTTIHGIIGYNLLKNFIVRINYKTKNLVFYNPKTFRYKKCKKCETFPFKFYRKKPYINVKVSLDTIDQKLTDVKLLIDSGGSDAMWLFEDSKEEIKTPKRFFYDLLGEGLSGPIYGNRSRVSIFKMGGFNIKNATASFLDFASTHNAREFKERNGSIGGGILKKFKIWIDYPNRKFIFKKNGSFTSDFNYNMSGLDLVYAGKQLVKEEVKLKNSSGFNRNTTQQNSISLITSYSFKFKPIFKIKSIVKNSPAYNAGLLKDDVIVSINGKAAYNFTLSNIIGKFQEKDKKKIKMIISRNGVKMKFEFKLHKRV